MKFEARMVLMLAGSMVLMTGREKGEDWRVKVLPLVW